METVLIIDDDRSVRETIGIMLEREGFQPAFAGDGQEGFRQALDLKPALILVDLQMPGLSGAEVCKQLRATGMSTPMIVISALGDEMDKVEMLEIGVDDYVVKPFGVRELMARIRAQLRRAAPPNQKIVGFSDVEVDLTRRVVRKSGEELKLTRTEYNLLTHFLQNADRILPRDLILNAVWGYDWTSHTRTLDAHVVRLRQKLEPDPGQPRYFLTVHGIGYRFVP